MKNQKIVGVYSKRADNLLWLSALVLVSVGVGLHYYFNAAPWVMKLIGWLVLTASVVGMVGMTRTGKRTFSFIKEAKDELYKIYWPTRQETYHSTLMVILIVAVIALIVWGIDSVLVRVIATLTGR
jgi:preprotein translocase subunit SecE